MYLCETIKRALIMIDNMKNIEFLNKLSNILIKKISPAVTTGEINKLFINFLGIEDTEFVIWDNNNMLLKNFAQDLKIFDDKNQSNENNYIYTNLAVSGGVKFYFNETEFDCGLKDDEFFAIAQLTDEINNIIFPLVSNGEVFGLMKITSLKQEFTVEFFELLNIASKLISGAIINYILNEQMEISLNFYKAMKDIAKIIESQYELSYIIPLIGEMIDRFITSHLIYIFVYKDNKYNLVWPNACRDEQVYKLLDKINDKTEFILSDNSQIGVFPIVNEENILGAIVAYSNIK